MPLDFEEDDSRGEVSMQYNKAKDELKDIHYANESSFPFSLYVSKLKKIFQIYEKAGRPYTGVQQVETMLDGIQPKELEPSKESALKDHQGHGFGQENGHGGRG